jgi:hypothetical protein
MSNYVPWYGKKREGLRYREEKLLRVLRRGQGRDAVERAAEEVLAARIRALMSDRARIPPCDRDDNAQRLQLLDEEIARCSSLAVEEIVDEYRRRLRASRHEASCSHGPNGSGDEV